MRTALLTLAILAAGAAPAAAADPADEPFSTDTVAETHRSAHPEMSAAQARLAAGEAPERDALVRLLGEQPATFGGASVDPPTNVLHVNATTPAAVDDAEELEVEILGSEEAPPAASGRRRCRLVLRVGRYRTASALSTRASRAACAIRSAIARGCET